MGGEWDMANRLRKGQARKNVRKAAAKKTAAPKKRAPAKRVRAAEVTDAELAQRVPLARSDSAKAFTIRMVTGRDPSQIDPTNLLSTWGYDAQHIDLLADAIDAAHWHNVYISHLEIEGCTTIQDAINLVASKMH